MKSSNKLMRAASRLCPNNHQRYKEMCALAATAQLGGAQMSELNAHISTCDSCRAFLESVANVSVQVMPLLAENRVRAADIVPPDGMRDRFLSRIASEELVNKINEGARIYPFLVKKPLSSTIGKEQREDEPAPVEPVLPELKSRVFWLLSRSAAVTALCVIVGTAGFYAGVWKGKHTPLQPAQVLTPSNEAFGRNSLVGDSDRLSQLEGQKSQLESALAKQKQ